LVHVPSVFCIVAVRTSGRGKKPAARTSQNFANAQRPRSSPIRTLTVGSGISPNQPPNLLELLFGNLWLVRRVAGFTAGSDFH
jgi:hypothetical protein